MTTTLAVAEEVYTCKSCRFFSVVPKLEFSLFVNIMTTTFRAEEKCKQFLTDRFELKFCATVEQQSLD